MGRDRRVDRRSTRHGKSADWPEGYDLDLGIGDEGSYFKHYHRKTPSKYCTDESIANRKRNVEEMTQPSPYDYVPVGRSQVHQDQSASAFSSILSGVAYLGSLAISTCETALRLASALVRPGGDLWSAWRGVTASSIGTGGDTHPVSVRDGIRGSRPSRRSWVIPPAQRSYDKYYTDPEQTKLAGVWYTTREPTQNSRRNHVRF